MKALTEQQRATINRAIATAMGYEKCACQEYCMCWLPPGWVHGHEDGVSLPNFYGSIDVMQYAVRSLRSVMVRREFERLLHKRASDGSTLVCLLPASAWADCFLRTLGIECEVEG